MKLSALLSGIPYASEQPKDTQIKSLASDSRMVKPGDGYLAYVNALCDRRAFIKEAIERGAETIFYQEEWPFGNASLLNAGFCLIPQLDQHLGLMAHRFYQKPSQALAMVGVTGTNGKSSCTYYLAQALEALKTPTGLIGTLGYGSLDQLIKSSNTTPGVIELHQTLAHLKQQGMKTVVMEVSSHGLEQNRVQEVAFDYALFTNLTREHLDYHGSMQAYGQAKEKLFKTPSLKHAIINVDDPFGCHLLKRYASSLEVIAVSLCKDQNSSWPTVFASHIELKNHIWHVHLNTPVGKAHFKTDLLGQFNLTNLLLVIATLLAMHYSLEAIMEVVPLIRPAPGRMQIFQSPQKPIVMVDYAHTPDALKKALKAIQEHYKTPIWCVLGCGGQRDPGKRPEMAAIAERYTQHVIFTDDNPRWEDPKKIIQDMKTGLKNPELVHVIPSRAKAISYAIKHAQPPDLVLIAGKGHEIYQLIKGQKQTCDDRALVRQLLN